MNGKRLIYVFAILLAVAGVGSLAYLGWESQKEAAQLRGFLAIYNEAESKLREGDAPGALQILNTRRPAQLPAEFPEDWNALTLEAALEAKRFAQVERLVASHRHLIDSNEAAALWWARTLMHRRETTMWRPILDHWVDQGDQAAQWVFLDADADLVEGRLDAAREKLEGRRFDGVAEAQRRLRLAMLTADPETAWAEHSAAYANAPNAPDTRLMAATFLESQGRTALARREYVAAALLEPENPLNWERLGAYYRRANALPQAITTWTDGLQRTQDPRLWWRAWFWQRVTRPRGVDLSPPTGDWWGSLPQDLAAIPERLFLGESFTAKHPNTPAILTQEEGFAWLQVLEALQNQEEAQALEYLRFMPNDRAPYAPTLQAALTRLLQWRVNGSWPNDPPVISQATTHRFLRLFEDFFTEGNPQDPASLDTFSLFLNSDFAPSALFLANGWLQAARWLQPSLAPASFSNDPRLDWMPYAQVKAIALLEGDEPALKAAAVYPSNPAVQVLAAELTLRTGAVDQALERLDAWVQDPSPAGFRAAYLRALAALERGDFDRLDAIMNLRDDLASRSIGKELLARAALAQGDRAGASQIYGELGTESTEALVFLYEEAKTARLWSEARTHVNALIRQSPNEPAFHRWARELDTLEANQP